MKYSKGQIAVIMTLVIGVLLGECCLGTDVAVLYYNWTILQKAADSAVLAGAGYLPGDPSAAVATAKTYAQNNFAAASEIVSGTPVVSSSPANANDTITISLKRTV